jgi:hypothetical protein
VTQGTTTIGLTGDAGPSEGQQTLSVAKQTVTAVYVGRVAYVNADSVAIAKTVGISSIVTGAVGRWVSFGPSEPDYGVITQGITLSSAMSELLNWSNPVTLGKPTVVDGQQVMPITGEAHLRSGPTVKATLDVTRTAHPLPVEINASSSTASETAIFSNWGHSVSITAPSGAQPVSSFKG